MAFHSVMGINKKILLAVCGGVAAYKSAELVRVLTRQNHSVRVVMTENAQSFVGPLTFQALSGFPVHCDFSSCEAENGMGHIELARWADLMLIAPATANCIAKLNHGLADDLVSTLYLAAQCPVFIAPAMNQAMWLKPVTQSNIENLQRNGCKILGPDSGIQACGETGPGRMLEPEAISRLVLNESGLLQGKAVLISAGPTREALDPVRFISNRSSGKMGYALAQAAAFMGARVSLVSGPVNLPIPSDMEFIAVESAEQMHQAVMSHAAANDIYIGAAAVADYTPQLYQQQKMKKNRQPPEIQLKKTRDILADVAALPDKPFTVGFAAETENLQQYAVEKLQRKNADMIAANYVGREMGGFDSDQNALSVFWTDGSENLLMNDKTVIAEQLMTLIVERMNEKRTTKNS